MHVWICLKKVCKLVKSNPNEQEKQKYYRSYQISQVTELIIE